MRNRIKTFPYHTLLLAAYPVLALFANNLGEVSTDVFLRSLAITLAAATALLLLARAVLKSWHRAALLVSLLLLAFFAYGHVYDLKKSLPFLAEIMRHRFLAPLWLALLLAGVALVLRSRENPRLTPILNIAAAVMLATPLVQVGRYALVTSQEFRAASGELPGTEVQRRNHGDLALHVPLASRRRPGEFGLDFGSREGRRRRHQRRILHRLARRLDLPRGGSARGLRLHLGARARRNEMVVELDDLLRGHRQRERCDEQGDKDRLHDELRFALMTSTASRCNGAHRRVNELVVQRHRNVTRRLPFRWARGSSPPGAREERVERDAEASGSGPARWRAFGKPRPYRSPAARAG